MKNIILCSDGTGNAGGRGQVTNVWRLFTALDLSNRSAVRQVAIHDDGVGTEEFKVVKAVSGAFGLGLKRNVRELYRFLIRNYEPAKEGMPGDQIYILGFSRGAYTARMLAELISVCGIINPEGKNDATLDNAIREAFEIFRCTFLSKIDRTLVLEKGVRRLRNIEAIEAEQFIADNCYPVDNNGDAEHNYLIRFLGVWDTVPAYGFPVQELADLWNNYIYPYKFDNRKLNPRVGRAVHALAVDDARKTFCPMLFDELTADGVPDNRIEQVWFPGMHANIGGGYPKDGLAYISLDWMMSRAVERIGNIDGLKFIEDKRKEFAARGNPWAKMYDSRSGLAVFYRYEPRDIKHLAALNHQLSNDSCGTTGLKIHPSVIQRIQARTEGYAPGNIPKEAELSADDNTATTHLMACFKEHQNNTDLLPGVRNLISLRQFLHAFKLIIPVILLVVSYKDVLASRFSALSWLPDAVDSSCGKPCFTTLGVWIEKVLGLFPGGKWLYTRMLEPTLACHWIFVGVVVLIIFVWGTGYIAKKITAKKHANFWVKML